MTCSRGGDGQVPEGAAWGGVAGVGGVLRSGSNGQLVEAVAGGEWGAAANGGEVRSPVGAQLG